MNCPDTENPIKLKNHLQQRAGDYKDFTYYFLIDTCQNLAWVTGLDADTDCEQDAM